MTQAVTSTIKSGDASSLNVQFDRHQMRQSLKFSLSYVAVIIMYVVVYLALDYGNMVPVASASIVICLHLFLLAWQWLSRSSTVAFSAGNGMLMLVIAICSALAHGMVQVHFLQLSSLYAMFGDAPVCAFGDIHTCVVDQMHLNPMLLQTSCSYLTIFVLPRRATVVATPLAILVYGFIVYSSGSEYMRTSCKLEGIVFASNAMLAVVAKWHLEAYQWKVFVDLHNKGKEVVSEKSLRFQAEHKLELLAGSMRQTVRQGAPTNDIDTATDNSSAQGTDNTAQVFDAGSSQVAAVWAAQLNQIVKVGKKEHWLIDETSLSLTTSQLLGVGGFGVVVAGSLYESPVAVKISRRRDTQRWGKAFIELCNELRILRRIRHPNIVTFHGAYVDAIFGDIALVLELVVGPLLSTYVLGELSDPSGAAFDEEIQRPLVFGICRACRYLHALSPRVVHGDLKPRNVVVERLGIGRHPKLLDFGLSRILSKKATLLGGTQGWMDPALGIGTPDMDALAAGDVFALGCMIYFIETGNEPMAGWSKRKTTLFAKKSQQLPLQWSMRNEFETHCALVVSQCVEPPTLRPKMEDVCKQLMVSPTCSSSSHVEIPMCSDALHQVRRAADNMKKRQASNKGSPILGRGSPDPCLRLTHRSTSSTTAQRQISWLLSITVEFDAASQDMKVYSCMLSFATRAETARARSLGPPTCLQQWMGAETGAGFLRSVQLAVNKIGHGENDYCYVPAVILSSAFCDEAGNEWPVMACVVAVTLLAEDDFDQTGGLRVSATFQNFTEAEVPSGSSTDGTTKKAAGATACNITPITPTSSAEHTMILGRPLQL